MFPRDSRPQINHRRTSRREMMAFRGTRMSHREIPGTKETLLAIDGTTRYHQGAQVFPVPRQVTGITKKRHRGATPSFPRQVVACLRKYQRETLVTRQTYQATENIRKHHKETPFTRAVHKATGRRRTSRRGLPASSTSPRAFAGTPNPRKEASDPTRKGLPTFRRDTTAIRESTRDASKRTPAGSSTGHPRGNKDPRSILHRRDLGQ